MRAFDDPSGGLHGFLDGRVLVSPVEGLGRGKGEVHLVEPGPREPVVALLVEGEAGVDDAGNALDGGDDLLGAGHLGNAGGIDEADSLDPRQPRPRQPVDQLGPNLGRKDRPVVLEPVARAHVADRHAHSTPS